LLREGAKHSIDINADGSKPDENLKLTNNSDDESCDVI